MEDKLSCRVKLLFQPSEEGVKSGSVMMIEHGVLDDVDIIVGQHVTNALESGVMGVCPGESQASSRHFKIEFVELKVKPKATEIKGKYFYTHVENPNPKFLYGCLEASFYQYPIFSILSYLPEITNKYVSLKKNSLLLGLPLNFYYDENKEATMFVTWEKENGTVSTDKITCKWQFEENVDFLHGFEDIRTYKQFLRPAQIYVNDELMWDINNYQVLDSDSEEDKVAKNQITLYPYIELTK
jgi:hypothetical protein